MPKIFCDLKSLYSIGIPTRLNRRCKEGLRAITFLHFCLTFPLFFTLIKPFLPYFVNSALLYLAFLRILCIITTAEFSKKKTRPSACYSLTSKHFAIVKYGKNDTCSKVKVYYSRQNADDLTHTGNCYKQSCKCAHPKMNKNME